MSYQVGAACYATVVDAGAAACAAYSPVSQLVEDGAVVRTVSCSTADLYTGALNLTITSTPVGGSPSYSSTVQQSITYADCQQFAYMAALEVIFASLLGLWVVIYSGKKLIQIINWGRGNLHDLP